MKIDLQKIIIIIKLKIFQLLLSLPVFLLLRLSRREKFYESLSEHERNRRTQSYGTFTSSGRHRDRLLEEGNVQKVGEIFLKFKFFEKLICEGR